MDWEAWRVTVHGSQRIGHDWSDLACMHEQHLKRVRWLSQSFWAWEERRCKGAWDLPGSAKERGHWWGAQTTYGLTTSTRETEPTGSILCQPRGQPGAGPASDGAFWTWPWLPGGMGRLQLPGSLGRDTGLTANPGWGGGASSSSCLGSAQRGQSRHILGCVLLGWVCVLSHVQLFATPWTVAHQAPLSMAFPKQEY